MFPTPKRSPLRAALLSLALVLAIAPSAAASGMIPGPPRWPSLESGAALYVHEYLESPNGQHYLQIQRSGAARLFARGAPDRFSDRPTWDAAPNGGEGAYLVMDAGGDLKLRTRNGVEVWHTGTAGHPGATAHVQSDGNLVVKSAGGTPLWNSGTTMRSLEESDWLRAGWFITSPSGQYKLLMQDDGNLVLQSEGGGGTFWNTQTNGNRGAHAEVQTDGNFVIYRDDSRTSVLWSGGSAGHPGAIVRLQDDGNVVTYANGQVVAKWDSYNSRLDPGEMLKPGWSILSPNRLNTVVMQTDGNLVLYRSGAATGLSNTNGHPGAYAVMQAADGNLVVYGTPGPWNSGTRYWPGAYLDVQNDGRAVIYGGGAARWWRP